MFSSLSLIGLIFNLTFSYNLFLSSIIRKLYHFKPFFDAELKKKKKKKPGKKGPKTFADEIEEEEKDKLEGSLGKTTAINYEGDDSADDEYS